MTTDCDIHVCKKCGINLHENGHMHWSVDDSGHSDGPYCGQCSNLNYCPGCMWHWEESHGPCNSAGLNPPNVTCE